METPTDPPTPSLSEGARITLGMTFNAVHRRFLEKGLHNKRSYLALADRLSPANRFRLRKLQHQSPDLTNTMEQDTGYWVDVLSIIFEANDLLKAFTTKRTAPSSFEKLLPADCRPAIKEKADSLLNDVNPEGLALKRAMKAPVTDESARKVVHGYFMKHTFETKAPMVSEILNHKMLSHEARVIVTDLHELVSRYQQDPATLDEKEFHEVGGALRYMDPLKILLDAKQEAPEDEYSQSEGETVEWSILCAMGSQLYGSDLQQLEPLMSEA